jgi:hypothetical protein
MSSFKSGIQPRLRVFVRAVRGARDNVKENRKGGFTDYK